MNTFTVSQHFWENASTQVARLHSHHEYEIYSFLEGDSYYLVDGRRYELKKGDVIIIRKHEMHRVFHKTFGRYHSYVLFVFPEFFEQNNCKEYEKAFLEYGKDNKIDAHTAFSSGLTDAMERLKKYSNNFTVEDSPIIRSTLMEILYIINSVHSFAKSTKTNRSVKDIIAYLNENYTDGDVDLDTLADKFFISKFHLCRVFKETTGLTVQEYVKRKRLTLAMELKNDGLTLSEASAKAGFKDYSSFYRYYKKRYSISPTSKETI
jgi:AraC-like DNA-binding protein